MPLGVSLWKHNKKRLQSVLCREQRGAEGHSHRSGQLWRRELRAEPEVLEQETIRFKDYIITFGIKHSFNLHSVYQRDRSSVLHGWLPWLLTEAGEEINFMLWMLHYREEHREKEGQRLRWVLNSVTDLHSNTQTHPVLVHAVAC